MAPGNVYNGITLGSVGGAGNLVPSGFSSRSAVDFYNPQTSTTLVGVRAAVDIAAPGEQQILAAYLGPTGRLEPLTNVTQDPSPTNLYFLDMDGTSFVSPIVAGGVALMKQAAQFEQVTLDWFTGGIFDAAGNSGTRTSFANLDLQVWSVVSGSFATLVAESASLYNNVEMPRLTLPAGAACGCRGRR